MFLHSADQLAIGSAVVYVNLEQILTRTPQRMGMAFDKAGQNSAPSQVNRSRSRSAQMQHIGVLTHGNDLSILGRQGRCRGKAWVQGLDRGVEPNLICTHETLLPTLIPCRKR